MNYIFSIKASLVVFPFIAFLFSLPFILHQYHKYGSINPFRVVIIYSFILYLIVIYFLVILPLPSPEEVVYSPGMVRLIPFGFIRDFIKESSFIVTDIHTYVKSLKEPCFYTVVFNIFMTIPFGMYLRYYFKCSLIRTFIMTFLLSLFFELTQLTGLYFIYPYPYRIFDVDDLFMNTLGGVVGYFIMGVVDKFLPTREKIDKSSFEAGKIVSGFKRIVLFGLDLFLYLLLTILFSFFIYNKWIFLILFIFYYILYPYIRHGYTLGGEFLHVRLEFQKNRFLYLGLRIIFLYIYYFGSIIISLFIMVVVLRYLRADIGVFMGIFILSFTIMFLFYLINGIILLKNKRIFYDSIFKVSYISTIEEELR